MLPYKSFVNSVSLISGNCKCFSSRSIVKKVERPIGTAIKKINKENKHLFGKLLETRAQKRKNEKNQNFSLPGETGKEQNLKAAASERHWTRMLLQGKVIKIRRQSNPQFQTIVRIPRKEIEKSVSTCSGISANVGDSSDAEQKAEDVEAILPKIEAHSKNTSLNVLGGNHVKSMVPLPDNVLKSLPSFPLFNTDKTSEAVDCSSKPAVWKKEYYTYPSVSKILNATMSEKSRVALRRWQQRMIAELGQEGFMEFYSGLLSQGEEFHAAVRAYLSGVPEADLSLSSEGAEGCWHSLRHSVLGAVDGTRLLEEPLAHPLLRYQGITDCVAAYKGTTVLIEWKKSDKRKSSLDLTYDAPLQVCAYIGALNYDPRHVGVKVEGGMVVVAYSDGSPADLFSLSVADCQRHWQQWLVRLQQYWLRNIEVVTAE